jgi:hypothetical protein
VRKVTVYCLWFRGEDNLKKQCWWKAFQRIHEAGHLLWVVLYHRCHRLLILSVGHSVIVHVTCQIIHAFRTLGVYIGTNGGTWKQVEILQEHSQSYLDNIRNSALAPLEAYLSYCLYLWPKLAYPLACCTLTPTQCRYTDTSPVCTITKIHLNRHTHWSVFSKDPNICLLSELQLHFGFATPVLALPYNHYDCWIEYLNLATYYTKKRHHWNWGTVTTYPINRT